MKDAKRSIGIFLAWCNVVPNGVEGKHVREGLRERELNSLWSTLEDWWSNANANENENARNDQIRSGSNVPLKKNTRVCFGECQVGMNVNDCIDTIQEVLGGPSLNKHALFNLRIDVIQLQHNQDGDRMSMPYYSSLPPPPTRYFEIPVATNLWGQVSCAGPDATQLLTNPPQWQVALAQGLVRNVRLPTVECAGRNVNSCCHLMENTLLALRVPLTDTLNHTLTCYPYSAPLDPILYSNGTYDYLTFEYLDTQSLELYDEHLHQHVAPPRPLQYTNHQEQQQHQDYQEQTRTCRAQRVSYQDVQLLNQDTASHIAELLVRIKDMQLISNTNAALPLSLEPTIEPQPLESHLQITTITCSQLVMLQEDLRFYARTIPPVVNLMSTLLYEPRTNSILCLQVDHSRNTNSQPDSFVDWFASHGYPVLPPSVMHTFTQVTTLLESAIIGQDHVLTIIVDQHLVAATPRIGSFTHCPQDT